MDTATAEPTTLEVKEPEIQDEVQDIEIAGVNTDTFSSVYTTGKKGKAKGKTQLFLTPNEKEEQYSFHNRIRSVVGNENYDKCVQAMLRQACLDSTNQAIRDHKEGQLTDVGFSSAFIQWFLPSTRRSGVHIKDLREKAQELFNELNPMLLRHFKFKEGEEGFLTEPEHNRMIQLSLEYNDLQKKIEEKSRKGKTAATTPATTTK